MPVSAGDSWVAPSSTARIPVLAYMVATLGVSRDPVERRCVINHDENEPGEHTYVGGLVILDETAQRAFGGAHGPVEHVYVHFALLIFRFETAADFEPSALCRRMYAHVSTTWAGSGGKKERDAR